MVALGIDHTGRKPALGLWEGSTENTAVCRSLNADLQSRELRTDRSLLVILDGSKALHKAVTQTFGDAAFETIQEAAWSQGTADAVLLPPAYFPAASTESVVASTSSAAATRWRSYFRHRNEERRIARNERDSASSRLRLLWKVLRESPDPKAVTETDTCVRCRRFQENALPSFSDDGW
jgi:Transposase, Mutator family